MLVCPFHYMFFYSWSIVPDYVAKVIVCHEVIDSETSNPLSGCCSPKNASVDLTDYTPLACSRCYRVEWIVCSEYDVEFSACLQEWCLQPFIVSTGCTDGFFLNTLFIVTFHSGPSEQSINITILVLRPVDKILVQVSYTFASQDSHIWRAVRRIHFLS